jgi:hypothetical protein
LCHLVPPEFDIHVNIDSTPAGVGPQPPASAASPVPSPGIGNPVRTMRKDGSPHPLDGFRQIIEVKLVGTLNVIRLVEAGMRRL